MLKRITALAAGLLVLARAGAAQEQGPLRLTFEDAVRRAATRAPAVALAGARADAAAARARQTRGALLPGVSASAGWANRTFNRHSLGIEFPTLPGQEPLPDLIGPFDTWDARVSLRQTVLDPSSWARVRAVTAQVRSAEADEGTVRETAAQAASVAYLRAARAAALVGARGADSAIATELVTLARAQRDAGVSAAIDVTRAETQLVAAQGELVVARNQRDRALLDLARVIGLDPLQHVELADTLSAAMGRAEVPSQREAAIQLALAQRSDLAAERSRGDAARQGLSAVAAERLPRLDLAADYGANGPLVGSMIRTGQIGVQVTWPILDGWRREGRQAEQRAVVEEADIRARDLEQQVTAEVEGAFLDIAAAEAQGRIAAERLRLAEQELEQARDRFRAGVAGNIEVITAQASLLQARDADINARYAAVAARVSLARAVGVASRLGIGG
jgi:outer membrane protein TolC